MPAVRLDVLLVEQGFFVTRSRAQAAIMAGEVFVNGQKIEKCGTPVNPECSLEVRGSQLPYVSRGGLKLEKALAEFGVSPAGLVCLDIGASTGGFTDCLLQKGARLVYAVDVGYGQLAWKLRQDQRVIVLEKTNARNLTLADLKKAGTSAKKNIAIVERKILPVANGTNGWFERPQLVVMDVSFISITNIFPVFHEFTVPEVLIISLIKPQFEAGRREVAKGGLVKKSETHLKVLNSIYEKTRGAGFFLEKLTFSPITGADGNLEFLGLWSKNPNSSKIMMSETINTVVKKAHEELNHETK